MRSACVLVVMSACSFTHGALSDARQGDGSVGTGDASRVDAALGAWSLPVEITELGLADDPSLTDDLLEIYINSARPGSVMNTTGQASDDIWVSTRSSVSSPWSSPTNVDMLNSAFAETTMRVTGDGKAIFFNSDRTGNADIWFSTRLNRQSPWSTPARVLELSTAGGDYAPYARSDLTRVIMCSGATVGQEALWVSERATATAPWGNLVLVGELEEAGISECDPITPHDRVIYYASNRGNDYNIYVARRSSPGAPYGVAVAIPELSTSFGDRDVWVSTDERYMVFASNRDTNWRLYLSTR